MIAVDGSGNVYIADNARNLIYKETLSGGGYTQSTVPTGALNDPCSVAVDGSGNLYIVDCGNYRVLKETLSAGSYSESIVASFTVGIGTGPGAVAVDGAGNLYISSIAGALE